MHQIKKIWILLIGVISLTINAQNPSYVLDLRNDEQVSGTVYEFDIYLLRTGSIQFEYASGQYGIILNPLIRNGGNITASIVPGSSDASLVATSQNPITISFFVYPGDYNVVRIGPRNIPDPGPGAIISNVSPGARLCRVRITNSIEFGQFQPNLTWTTTTIYPTQISAFVSGSPLLITNHTNHLTSNLLNPILNIATTSDNNDNYDLDYKTYPNPFRDRVIIDYNLRKNSYVQIAILDGSGKLVRQLVKDNQPAGSYSVEWDSALSPAGIYLVKLQMGDKQHFSKITLIR